MSQINTNPPKNFISRYEIVSKVGSGGMGVVYKAKDPLLDKTFAVKVISTSHVSDDIKIRFQKEAKALKNLRHNAIPEVYNFAISRDNEPYMVMEYIEGKSLQEVLAQIGQFEIDQAIQLVIQICDALEYAHEHGVVHRDLKPANLILEQSEQSTEMQVKVIDFGLAKLDSGSQDEQDMTKSGLVIGSPPYMSPEQIRGNEIDHRSDIYSLGCVFYEMLTGKQPFLGKTALATISMHVSDKAPELKDKDQSKKYAIELEQIIEICLKKDRNERFETVAELKNRLLGLLETEFQTKTQPLILDSIETERPKLATISQKDESAIRGSWYSSKKSIAIICATILVLGIIVFAINASVQNVSETYSSQNEVKKKIATKFDGPTEAEERFALEKFIGIQDEDKNAMFSIGNTRTGKYEIKADEKFNDQDLYSAANRNQNIEVWNLSGSKVTSKGLRVLGKTRVSNLKISNTNVEDLSFLKNIPNLKTLVVGQSPMLNSQELAVLNKSSIEALFVSGPHISSKNLKEIATIKSLKILSLAEMDLQARDIDKLAELPKLNEFMVRRIALSDQALKSIINLPHLEKITFANYDRTKLFGQNWLKEISKSNKIRTISFDWTTPSSKSLLALTKMRHLERLIFNHSNVKNSTILKLRLKIPNCKIGYRKH